MSRHEDGAVHTLVGAYALDAVTDLERKAVERHLVDCEMCAAEVAELRDTAARLGSAAATTPPPSMRAKVLRDAARTRQDSPVAHRPGAVGSWRHRLAAAAVAAVLVLTAAGVTYGVQQQRVDSQRDRATAAAQQRDRIATVLSASDAELAASGMLRGGGRARVVVSRTQDHAVVVVTGLPAQRSGKVYQLWLMTGTDLASAHSAKVLDPGQRAVTTLISGLHDRDTFGISVEPTGGSRHPTDHTVYGALSLPT